MREIKFQILHKCTECGHLNFELIGIGVGGVSIKHLGWLYSSCPCVKAFEFKGYEPQKVIRQFTGLSDKNGVEIYEGDIVKQTYEITGAYDDYSAYGYWLGVARIFPSAGVVMNRPLQVEESDSTNITKEKVGHFKHIRSYRAEVIGNIHENPELLEE